MKLATLKDSTRDGKLVVVSKDLTRCSEVGHIARTLQAALDDWAHVAPRLMRVALGLETGSQPTLRFHEHDAASPLPRAFFWSGGTGPFCGPRDALQLDVEAGNIALAAQLAVITDDVEAGGDAEAAQRGAVLLLLSTEVSIGGETIVSTFSPVAVTPDELGEGNALSLLTRVNGKAIESGAGSLADAAKSVATAARLRPLGAGSLVGTKACLAASTLAPGDTYRIEMNDRTGHSIFGAIEQTLGGRS